MQKKTMPNNHQTKERMCVVCRKRSDKGDMLRIVRATDGKIVFDRTGKMEGRGAYVCNNIDCIKQCAKKKLLNRSFKCALPEEIYQSIVEEYEKQNN
ncbi:MAG: YlxR family protein [Clostridia bacterium]|nr:YlxR family protein [Clostridia bacterium]